MNAPVRHAWRVIGLVARSAFSCAVALLLAIGIVSSLQQHLPPGELGAGPLAAFSPDPLALVPDVARWLGVTLAEGVFGAFTLLVLVLFAWGVAGLVLSAGRGVGSVTSSKVEVSCAAGERKDQP